MYCCNCGKEIPNDSKFCQHCGQIVPVVEERQEGKQKSFSESKQIVAPKVKTKQTNLSKKKLITIISVSLGMILCLFVGIWCINQHKYDSIAGVYSLQNEIEAEDAIYDFLSDTIDEYGFNPESYEITIKGSGKIYGLWFVNKRGSMTPRAATIESVSESGVCEIALKDYPDATVILTINKTTGEATYYSEYGDYSLTLQYKRNGEKSKSETPSVDNENISDNEGNSKTIKETGLTNGEFTYNVFNDDTIEITKYNKSEESISIPSEINDNAVVRIGDHAFNGCTSIKEIYLPSDIETIGKSAFENCTKLEGISFYGVSIGESAFKGCTNLKEVWFSSDVETIGKSAFENCTKLEGVSFYGESIQESAFKGCTNLKEVWFSSDVEIIGKSAFENCTKLEGVSFYGESIQESAFKGCTSLKEVYFSSDVETIGKSAFENCTQIEEVSFYGESIEEAAFKGCTSLKEVYLSSDVEKVHESAFDNCPAEIDY